MAIAHVKTCCPCPDVVGCQCNTNCALECRAKAGTAELCGFSEACTAAEPPKKFRRRILQTSDGSPGGARGADAPFIRCGPVDCSDPACPASWSTSGYHAADEVFGPGTGTTYEASFTPSGPGSPGTTLYTAAITVTHPDGFATNPHIRVVGPIPGDVDDFDATDGNTYELTDGLQYTLALKWNHLGNPRSVGEDCVIPTGQCEAGTYYVWDSVEQYDAETCALSQEGESFLRQTGGDCGCPEQLPDTADEPILCGGPQECLEDGIETTHDVASGECRHQGVGCVPEAGAEAVRWAGLVVETLEDEDTEEDAIARAGASEGELEAVENCKLHPAFKTLRGEGEFEFGFRRAQVRVRLIDQVPGTYNVSVHFYRRLLGSSGPYVFFSTEELTVVVDSDPGTIDYSPWIETPNEAGWETRPQECEVEPA